jgi:hypothetical protein
VWLGGLALNESDESLFWFVSSCHAAPRGDALALSTLVYTHLDERRWHR